MLTKGMHSSHGLQISDIAAFSDLDTLLLQQRADETGPQNASIMSQYVPFVPTGIPHTTIGR